LTFVIAGGGFAGVETAGAINDYLSYAVNYYPRLQRSDVRVIVVHAHDPILPEYSADLGHYAQRKLEEKGVRVIVNNRVVACDGDDLVLEDNTRLDADTLIWTCGVSPSALLANLPCPKKQDRLEADACMQVRDWNNVWAAGDCAYILDPRNGKPYPQTAQHAFRQGKLLAKNVLSVISGGTPHPFLFNDMGQLATIGERTAVARIMMFKFHGFFAWFLWRCIYLTKLPEFNRKCHVLFDWFSDIVFERDIVQFMNAPPDTLDGQIQLTSEKPKFADFAKSQSGTPAVHRSASMD
jgi:NADH dehydrogenase